MSFKNFIYYCALCGGWAAFLAWLLAEIMGVFNPEKHGPTFQTVAPAALVGLFVASTIGMLDALLNAVGFQRVVRAMVCLIVGTVGGVLGGFLGHLFYSMFKIAPFRVAGWATVGVAIGASIGVFDLQRAMLTRQPLAMARRKMMNGLVGGAVGGVLGGVFFEFIAKGFIAVADMGIIKMDPSTMASPRAFGLVILGMCIGLLIGTAQVVLKEAWLKVEAGFKAGREMMLSKPETTVGRGEGNDIGLFGDNGIEKQHCKIVLQGGRYQLVEIGSPAGGTYVNGERISGPTPLRSGDLIGLGKSALRFGERTKRQ